MITENFSRDEIRSRVIQALENVLNRPLDGLSDETRLFDDLNIDSTGVLGMLMELEDATEIEVDPDEIEQEHLVTLGSLTDFIRSHSLGSRANQGSSANLRNREAGDSKNAKFF